MNEWVREIEGDEELCMSAIEALSFFDLFKIFQVITFLSENLLKYSLDSNLFSSIFF